MRAIKLSMLAVVATLSQLCPQQAVAMNRDITPEMDRPDNDSIRRYEAETQLERDLLGRKLVIDPNSNINPGSLYIEVAPGSTVVLRADQRNKGVQKNTSPFYKNVEIPN